MRNPLISLATALSSLALLGGTPVAAQSRPGLLDLVARDTARFATFNASLNRNAEGQLIRDLSTPFDPQARAVAEILQRVRPDVVLINEFDFDAAGTAADLFRRNYLERSQGGADPIRYPFVYAAPSNTGIPSGLDLDNDGRTNGPGDAFGFGFFPGQFGMLLLSQHPILEREVRTFQEFRWRDMPGALLPDDPNTPEPADYYSAAELDVFRLSSKSHWDVPVRIGRRVVHMLCAHPTPPVFDGPEDRNGRRNHDEIRLFADYVTPGAAGYLVDDAGRRGGLRAGAEFVVLGDYNSDPLDGDSIPGAMQQLLQAPRVVTRFTPRSGGGLEAAAAQGGANAGHRSDALADTADFGDSSPGNLRVDYVLPSDGLAVVDSGVFWPVSLDPLAALTGDGSRIVSSDHRLVFVDVRSDLTALEFLGEDTIRTGFRFADTEVGGLSGFQYLPQFDLYVALSDDRSQLDPARYYALSIDLADDRLDAGDVRFLAAFPMLDENGLPFAPLSVDPEGIAVSDEGFLLIASEGDANAGIDPFVDAFFAGGSRFGSLPIPTKFRTGTAGSGIRNNLAFESLAFTPGERSVFTATENALAQDGPPATLVDRSLARILRYRVEAGLPTEEYAYPTDRVAFPTRPAGAFATNGLVELLVLDGEGDPADTLLLALERSFSVGVGNEIRLYLVSLRGADDVSSLPSLAAAAGIYRAARKQLLLDFRSVGIDPDNVEGMTFGPTTRDGRRTLVLVSDNNFNAVDQRTQFLAFALPRVLGGARR